MSLLTEASLVITPNAVEEGTLFSIIPTDGSGDMTAVRATTATLVNSEGVIEDCPYNLLQRSQEFDNAIWTKTAGVVVTANSEISPNGTMTADTINFGASNRFVAQGTSLSTGVIVSGSIYVKGISGQTIQLAVGGVDVLFTLNGNWQKLEATRTSVSNSFNLNTFGGATARIISVWGAQLVTGTESKEYFPTTDRLNVPRLDYTNGSCPSILVEPQRTNLVLRSEEFDNASWSKTASTITANATTAPSGNLTADKLVEDATNNQHRIDQTTTSVIGTNTFSVFAKKSERDSVWLRVGTSGAYFDLTNGTISGISGVTASIENYGNGWYRCIIVRTSTVANEIARINLAIGTNGSYAGTAGNGLLIWGAQLEAGSNATSYIPTVASAVTRNADVISKTGISDLINSEEGVFYTEIAPLTIDSTSRDIEISDGNTNRVIIQFNNTGISAFVIVGGVVQASLNFNNSDTDFKKVALRYKVNDFALFVNGVKIAFDTSGATFPPNTLTRLDLKKVTPSSLEYYGKVKALCLWKTALTDTQLTQLTTP